MFTRNPSFTKLGEQHMLINQAETAIDHFHNPNFQYRTVSRQEAQILEVMRPGKSYTLSELAHLTKLEKSSVSGRVNKMLKGNAPLLVKGLERKCYFTDILCRTVQLPRG